MIARGVAGRIARHERYRWPRSSYVLHLSTPPKAEELAAIDKARSAGGRFAVLTPSCASAEEWLANCAPREALQ
jgi:hypothetical protein